MLYRLTLLAGLLCIATSTLADHIPRDSILDYWNRKDRVFHTSGPASKARELVEAPAERRPSALMDQATQLLARSSMFSLLLLDHGQLVFEGYANKASQDHKLVSFSTSKSLTALALGEALCAGKIGSIDEKIAYYAPTLAGTAYGRASIRNVLKMASGASADFAGWDGANWKDLDLVVTGKQSLLEYIQKYGAQATVFGTAIKEGEIFRYNGLNTESLAFSIEGATGTPFHVWFQNTVWSKSGGTGQAQWTMDKEGKAVSEALFIGTSREYARIALYFLDTLTGKSGDKCMEAFLNEAVSPHMPTSNPTWPHYGYQIWIDRKGNPWFVGHGGQMVGFHRKSEKILVTLGYKYSIAGVMELFNSWTFGD